MELLRSSVAPEVVWIGDAALAQALEFRAAFGDQVVLGRTLGLAHCAYSS
jgi:hypothetical protein